MSHHHEHLPVTDQESQSFLLKLADEARVRANRVENVRTVLVILSSKAMVYDTEALKVKILLAYPEAKIYFMTTLGKSMGPKPPAKIDLLIDFTGPRMRHKWFLARRLRSITRVCVGRTAGFFREFIYDRVFDETKDPTIPKDVLLRERIIQRKVLELAGVPLSQKGLPMEDRGREIALQLPPLRK